MIAIKVACDGIKRPFGARFDVIERIQAERAEQKGHIKLIPFLISAATSDAKSDFGCL